MKKDDKALMRVITPYISWTLENGLAFISLGDERKRLERSNMSMNSIWRRINGRIW